MKFDQLVSEIKKLSDVDQVRLLEKCFDCETDKEGQIMIFTGMFEQSNGSVKSIADPNFKSED